MNTYQAIAKYATLWHGERLAVDEEKMLTMRRNFARRYLAIKQKKDKNRAETKELMDIRDILIDRYAELQRMPNLMENESLEYQGLAKFLGLPGEIKRTMLEV